MPNNKENVHEKKDRTLNSGKKELYSPEMVVEEEDFENEDFSE